MELIFKTLRCTQAKSVVVGKFSSYQQKKWQINDDDWTQMAETIVDFACFPIYGALFEWF